MGQSQPYPACPGSCKPQAAVRRAGHPGRPRITLLLGAVLALLPPLSRVALEVAQDPGGEHLALLLGQRQPRALAQPEHVLDERLGEGERLVAGVGVEAVAGRDDAAQDEIDARAGDRRAGLDAAV